MTDVYIVVYSLIGILISLPGLLLALNLLLPGVSERVQVRLNETPGRSFVLGVPVAGAFLLFIAITSQIPGGQAFAFIAGGLGMGLGTLGAAGMARLLGQRLNAYTGPLSRLKSITLGAAVYELACLVPIVGWFLFAPLVGTALLGAAVFALLGWLPKPVARNQSAVVGNQSA